MKRWMWYAIASFVAIIASCSVFYGVYSHKEPGLMTACWENGKANYEGKCEELTWKRNQIPITYYISFDIQHEDYIDSVRAGAHLWNKEVCFLLREVDRLEDAMVLVSWGNVDITSAHAGGHTSHEGQTGPEYVHVVLKEPSDTHAVYRYAAHEFGHVLGLAHDTAPNSIMYPIQPNMTEKLSFVLPSDHDIKLLQERLCP